MAVTLGSAQLVAALVAGLAGAPAPPAAPAVAPGAEFAPAEVLVRFQGQPAAREVPLPAGIAVGSAVRALRRNAAVASVTPNYIARASAAAPYIPNDPGLAGTPGGWQQAQWNFLPAAGVDAPLAWGNLRAAGRPGASGVRVAVLDTGIASERRGRFRRAWDFARSQFIPGYDFVSKDRFPLDHNGHGTHIAGTIAERADNGAGLTGLAYGAKLIPVRVLDGIGEGEADDIANGIRFAVKKRARVINLSFEFDVSVRGRDVPEVVRAVRFAYHRGALVVTSVGNLGGGRLPLPAGGAKAVAVGGTTINLCLGDYSAHGTGLDLVAPGGGDDASISADPHCQSGSGGAPPILQLTYVGGVRRLGYPRDYIGTSMSAAHVSGAAALVIASGVLGSRPRPGAVERRLKSTARDLGAPGYDTLYGFGLVNAGAATSSG
jgi:serine protease